MGNNGELIIGGVTISIGLIIFLLVILLIIAVNIVAIVLIVTIIRKNKQETAACREFVLKNSLKLKQLDEANKSVDFFDFKTSYSVYNLFDNKRNWYRTEPIDYFRRYLREDYVKWVGLKRQVEANRENLQIYRKKIKAINFRMSQSYCEKNNMKYKKCIKIEREEFQKRMYSPKTRVLFRVQLRYISKKGRVDESKIENYFYEEFARVLDSISNKRLSREVYESLVAGERSVLTDSMRYDVMRRDNFRCVLCGMSSREGAILHVDHIIPVSKGGKTEMSNLRTLCERCNLGKSNKIE